MINGQHYSIYPEVASALGRYLRNLFPYCIFLFKWSSFTCFTLFHFFFILILGWSYLNENHALSQKKKKKKDTNLKKEIERKILSDVLICRREAGIMHASSNCSSGFFSCHFRIYIRNTFAHCITYIPTFISFSLIKDIYIWKKYFMMAEKIVIHLGELRKKQFCLEIILF